MCDIGAKKDDSFVNYESSFKFFNPKLVISN